MTEPFAVWITGLPASGKSTLAAALERELSDRGVKAAVLESDALRSVLTPRPRYDPEERDTFYGAMVFIGTLLLRHGIPVIFDATANLRRYRERARELVPRFFEVLVECPREVCEERDPKGLYRKAREGTVGSLPGAQAIYEPPEHPDFVVRSDRERAGEAARRIAGALIEASRAPASPPPRRPSVG